MENMKATEIIQQGLADLMKRDMQNANKEIQVSCAEGIYKITYDADGYAVKAVRINV